MKKLIFAFLIIILFATSSFAGLYYMPSQSINYARMLSRNGSYDSADCVVYNPAAAAIMDDGLYFFFSNLFLIPKLEIKNSTGEHYKSKNFYPIIPNIQLLFKKDIYALFLSAGVVGGGGGINYTDGFPFFGAPSDANSTLNAYAVHIGVTAGGSISLLNKLLSFSLSGRLIYGYIKSVMSTGAIEGDIRKKALGFAPIIGVNLRPLERLNIGLRFEFQTNLKFKTTVLDGKNFGGTLIDGSTEYINFPALFGVGVEYKFIPNVFKISISFNMYFTKMADKYNDIGPTVYGGYDDDYTNAYDISIGAEYHIVKQFAISMGFQYVNNGGNENTFSKMEAELDYISLSTGFKWTLRKNMDLIFSIGGAIFFAGENAAKTQEYKRAVINIGLGIHIKLL